MTVAYGVAQILAPAITGLVGRATGGYAGGLYLAAAMMALGTLLMLVLKWRYPLDLQVERAAG
jgi:hypothetical protein